MGAAPGGSPRPARKYWPSAATWRLRHGRPDTLQRRFLNTGGIITSDATKSPSGSTRRTYSPVLRQAALPHTITVPWWEGHTLRYEYA